MSEPFQDLAAVFLDGLLDPKTERAAARALQDLISQEKLQRRVCQIVASLNPQWSTLEAITPQRDLAGRVFNWTGLSQRMEIFSPESTTGSRTYYGIADPKTSVDDPTSQSSWAAARGGSSTLRVSSVAFTTMLRRHGFLVFGGQKFSRFSWETDNSSTLAPQAFWLRGHLDSNPTGSPTRDTRHGYFPAVAYLRRYPSGVGYHLYTLDGNECPCWVNPSKPPDRYWRPALSYEVNDVEDLTSAFAIVQARLSALGY